MPLTRATRALLLLSLALHALADGEPVSSAQRAAEAEPAPHVQLAAELESTPHAQRAAKVAPTIHAQRAAKAAPALPARRLRLPAGVEWIVAIVATFMLMSFVQTQMERLVGGQRLGKAPPQGALASKAPPPCVGAAAALPTLQPPSKATAQKGAQQSRLLARPTAAPAASARPPPARSIPELPRSTPPVAAVAREVFLASLESAQAQAVGVRAESGGGRPFWSSAFSTGSLAAALARWGEAAAHCTLLLIVLEDSTPPSLQLVRAILPELGSQIHALNSSPQPAVLAVRVHVASSDGAFLRDEFALSATPALLLLWGSARPAERLVLRARELLSRPRAHDALADASARASNPPSDSPAEGSARLLRVLSQFGSRPPEEMPAEREERFWRERAALIAEQDAEYAAGLAADEAEAERAGEGSEGASEAGSDRAAAHESEEEVPPPGWWLARQALAGAAEAEGDLRYGGRDGISIVVRLCSGRRIARRWPADASLAALHAWVEHSCRTEEDAPEQFVLVTTYPRRVLERSAAETVGSALASPAGSAGALLHVEETI
ncbi:hypothetical protein T492DRAFT_957103 [Pavlovales sp. CCMP2436]|nr:hypothetical protein T492DRAFT_957103 [Pavlovales sp. CCMP2436]